MNSPTQKQKRKEDQENIGKHSGHNFDKQRTGVWQMNRSQALEGQI